ncbi:hypothetical protein WJX74_004467 [Apatococcus lobatus]|uniref:DNA repair protein UVH3 n=1 Tax=Apatococcus lobatus TaxID=904363 RepID=A0AAW1QB89_9CHLO
MGVQGLWSLLEPVGRRVNIEALSNKKVAVDASIWLVQFIKAMRDEKGEMLRNAHLVGFFRRICRLLFHRIRPVFVFDGATPALKRRTTIARRRRREQQTAKLRKTAEKMLMAQLRKHALSQANQHMSEEAMPGLGAKETLEAVRAAMQQDTPGPDPLRPGGPDEDLAAFANDLQDVPEADDPEAAKLQNDSTVKVDSPPADSQQEGSRPHKKRKLVKAGARAQQDNASAMPGVEDLGEDANIAAVMGAEMDAQYADDPQAEDRLEELSDGAAFDEEEQGSEGSEEEEESDEEGEELMLPEGSTELDPEVLGTLPPSMQLEFMDKMRERMVSENREQFQARTGIPIDFSTFQMQQYLKASAFRRQMDKIKDAMNAKARLGESGVQTRRIAAQPGREYILHHDAPAGPAPSAASALSSNPAGVMDISLDLPAGERDLANLLAGGGQEGGGVEEDEEVEWENADENDGGSQPSSRPSSAAKPLHWRERARQRQKYWSLSHGFQFGRKLGDWGKDDENEDVAAIVHAAEAEDEELQEAIRQSLVEPGGGSPKGSVIAARAQQLLEAGEHQEASGRGSQVADRLRHIIALAGDDDDDGEEAQTNDAEDGEAASQEDQPHRAGSAAAKDPSQMPSNVQPGMRQPACSKHSQPPITQSPTAEGTALQDPLANRLEVADAEQAGGLQASRDQPTSTIDLADVAEPALAAAAEASADAAGAAAEVALPHKTEGDRATDEAALARKAKAAVIAADAAPGQLAANQFREPAADVEAAADVGTAGSKSASRHKKRSTGKAAVAADASSRQAVGDNMPSEPSVSIPPNSDAVPAGIPQPTLQGQPISSANNVASSDRLPKGAREPTPGAQPIKETANKLERKQAPSLAPSKKAGDVQDMKDGAVPSLGSLDFSGLAGMNVFKKRGAASPGTSSRASEPPPAGSKSAAANELQDGSALSEALAATQPVDTALRPESPFHAKQPVPQEGPAASGEEAALGAAESKPDAYLQEGTAMGTVPDHLRDQNSNDAMPDIEKDAAGYRAADGSQNRSGRRQAAETQSAEESRIEDKQPDPEGVLADDPIADAAQRDEKKQPLAHPGPEALSQNAQVMDDLQEAKEEKPAQEDTAIVAAGLEGAGPSLDIDEELRILEDEAQALQAEQKRQTRNADAPTNEMYGECMELLQMFGLPYIIAPMEAEAQCAWLDYNNLVDGVVTDDNDVFLFGGRHVYRNIFESRKYVEEYRTDDIERELGMDRQQLIQLGLLLGSDYSEGVAGVGIVNAIEIVHAFQPVGGLAAFRQWVHTPDEDLVAAAQALQGPAPRPSSDVPDQTDKAGDTAELAKFKRDHRGAKRNWDLAPTFPSRAVEDAYMKARVDDAKDSFFFGRPDLQLLQRFCFDRFGWGQAEVDKLLLPVLKAYDERQNQMTMDSYLSFSQRFAKFKSKRLQKAVTGITGVHDPELNLGDLSDPSKKGAAKGRKRKAAPAAIPEEPVDEAALLDLEMADGDVAPGGAPEGSMQSVLDSTPAATAPKSSRGRSKGKAAAAAVHGGTKGQRGTGRAQRPPARGRAGRRGGRGRAAQRQAEQEQGSAGSSSNEEAGDPHPPLSKGAVKRSLRKSARVDSYADDSAAKAEGVLAEIGSSNPLSSARLQLAQLPHRLSARASCRRLLPPRLQACCWQVQLWHAQLTSCRRPPSANKPGQPATEDKLPTNPSNSGQPAGTDNKDELAQQSQQPQEFSNKTQLSTSQQFEGKSPTAVGPNPDTAGEGGPGAQAFGNPFKSLGFGPGT